MGRENILLYREENWVLEKLNYFLKYFPLEFVKTGSDFNFFYFLDFCKCFSYFVKGLSHPWSWLLLVTQCNKVWAYDRYDDINSILYILYNIIVYYIYYVYLHINTYIYTHAYTPLSNFNSLFYIYCFIAHQAIWDMRFPPKDTPEPDPEVSVNVVKFFRTLDITSCYCESPLSEGVLCSQSFGELHVGSL